MHATWLDRLLVDLGHTPRVTSEPVDRRQRRRQSTRAALADAALELFEENGFAATTIDEIADRADVARRTFFRHFVSKEAVLFPTPEDYGDEVMAVLGRMEKPVTLAQLLDAFGEAATAMEVDAETHRRRAAVIAGNRLDVADAAVATFLTARDTVIDYLQDWGGSEPAALEPTLDLGVSLAIFIFAQAFVRWTEGGADAPLSEVLAETIDLTRNLMAGELALGEARPESESPTRA